MKQIIKNNFNFLETFIFEGNTSAVSISVRAISVKHRPQVFQTMRKHHLENQRTSYLRDKI